MKKGFRSIALIIAAIILVISLTTVFQSFREPEKSPTPAISPLPHVIANENEGVINIILGLNKIEELQITVDNNNALINPVEYVRNHCNWNVYELAVDKGPHILKVTNVRTQVNSEKNFDLDNKIWFDIYYSFNDSINIDQSSEGWVCE